MRHKNKRKEGIGFELKTSVPRALKALADGQGSQARGWAEGGWNDHNRNIFEVRVNKANTWPWWRRWHCSESGRGKSGGRSNFPCPSNSLNCWRRPSDQIWGCASFFGFRLCISIINSSWSIRFNCSLYLAGHPVTLLWMPLRPLWMMSSRAWNTLAFGPC